MSQTIRSLQSAVGSLSQTTQMLAGRGQGRGALGGAGQLLQSGLGLGQSVASGAAAGGVLGPIGAVLGALPGIVGGASKLFSGLGGSKDRQRRERVTTVRLDQVTIAKMERMRQQSATAFAQELESEQRTRGITMNLDLSGATTLEDSATTGQKIAEAVDRHASRVSGDGLTVGG